MYRTVLIRGRPDCTASASRPWVESQGVVKAVDLLLASTDPRPTVTRNCQNHVAGTHDD